MQYHIYANLFPMMNELEFETLCADIKKNGLRQPILTYQGKIIDGRNRYEACKKVGVTPQFKDAYPGGSVLEYVLSLNLNRRHLNESQRAMLAVQIKNLGVLDLDNSLLNNVKSLPIGKLLSDSSVAELVNVSPRSVARAKEINETGTEELKKEVIGGTMAVSTAAEIAKLDKSEQTEILEAIKDLPKKDIKKQIQDHFDKKKEDTPPDPAQDEFTAVAKLYGGRIQAKIKEYREMIGSASEAFAKFGKNRWLSNFEFDLATQKLESLHLAAWRVKQLAICPRCETKGCETCNDTGYMSKAESATYKDIDEYQKGVGNGT